MIATLIAIVTMFTLMIIANAYMLDAIQKDALNDRKPRNKIVH
ncbi:MAG: hypothetical protein NZ772_11650 [Cyanobacteria bacterium]|nr:hypothetical protein [Cyanobacteriota bacterium]MDW8200331.1 hypothetical protein [Cyanobacteriota bacterium SKYGB_h_bin112]